MTTSSLNERLRSLPSVDDVLASSLLDHMRAVLPHAALLGAVREAVSCARADLRAGREADVAVDAVAAQARTLAERMLMPSLRHVVNASGVIVHTNLGRSVLAESAVAAVTEVARGYSTLEYDTEGMCRGSRHAHCEQLICELTGAEAAIAVNNNAAAVMMVLSEFAAGHEAVVSRGELVEIGGSFRIPDIMELSRARMREVGTTNKTHAFDYERAISDDTAMLLKVHTSNYRMIGFTESVSARELRRIADAATSARRTRDASAPGILVYEDLGSGALLEMRSLGEHAEPTVGASLAAGCDLVSFSGDKLLGGPQAGIVVGSAELIGRLKRNPLARALRLDKMTLAALEATLRLYLDPELARAEIPTLRMLEAPAEQVRERACALAARMRAVLPEGCADVAVVPEISRAGGGALPMRDIDTYAVRLGFARGSAQECEEYLVRVNPVPIIARIHQEALLFDARTILGEGEVGEITRALAAYFAHVAHAGDERSAL
ncbi:MULTISPECIES: L-seryl-tRNA(Sec) selenium transferase [unclassified Adlercreutzia]|uniref:L-seryl-tRNA(Sec) selenium transferase n=1 Tax=unclassified Adlercreutzia TaxID=2636013 RepID=UPI0013EBB640|nr:MULTISPECIES: L-seryl-tRNA(Sec) selenium transferase [unclassified Adlercreutzia]